MHQAEHQQPVEEDVRSRILDGRIRPGERLIEERLADEIGVSRTPVREALIVLGAQGLVRRARRGWLAVTYSEDDLEDAFEMRAVLEGLAARQAAGRKTAREMEAIRDACADVRALTQDMDGEGVDADLLSAANSRFHVAVVAASHNTWLARALQGVFALPLVLNAQVHDTLEDRIRFDQFHGWITEAIVQEDGVRAERLTIEHVFHGRDAVMQYVRRDRLVK